MEINESRYLESLGSDERGNRKEVKELRKPILHLMKRTIGEVEDGKTT
jgi:hypothetical protein